MKPLTAFLLAGLAFGPTAIQLYAGNTTYDVALDFSTNSNPNGVWSYGYATSLGGNLILYDEWGDGSGLLFWRHNLSLGAPSVVWNSTTNTIHSGSPVFDPGEAAFHPGPNGQYSVFRFTAPAAGSYYLESSFFGSDTVGTTSDVHVLLNDAPIFDGSITGFGTNSSLAFNTNLVLEAGDRVDLAVGFGNGSFYYDTTGISARLVREAPGLSIVHNPPDSVVVFWPATADGWRLEAATNLSPDASAWTEVPPPYQTNGLNLQVIGPASTANRFYRLHIP